MVTNDELQAFADRLNLVLDEEGYPPKGSGRQNKLAKDWGLSQKGVRKWLEGEGVPETTRLIEMAKRYGVSFEWLATGRDHSSLGASRNVVRASPQTLPAESESLSGDALELVRAIAEADASGLGKEAFQVLRETLRLFRGGIQPPHVRGGIEDPDH
ncbi:helix-turn-helix domain-containing protein [Burkholderia gladioli]|uniref:helix-turn-helix domain-containing protein n=1 Tax=Burkholderia gladioli TaxID=28095 RepID=UPI00163EEFB9|nr:helix-turn-helix transcriptional regulator [Burkholderia gladioli]